MANSYPSEDTVNVGQCTMVFWWYTQHFTCWTISLMRHLDHYQIFTRPRYFSDPNRPPWVTRHVSLGRANPRVRKNLRTKLEASFFVEIIWGFDLRANKFQQSVNKSEWLLLDLNSSDSIASDLLFCDSWLPFFTRSSSYRKCKWRPKVSNILFCASLGSFLYWKFYLRKVQMTA